MDRGLEEEGQREGLLRIDSDTQLHVFYNLKAFTDFAV